MIHFILHSSLEMTSRRSDQNWRSRLGRLVSRQICGTRESSSRRRVPSFSKRTSQSVTAQTDSRETSLAPSGSPTGNNGLVFRERYIFDRARCEGPLAELQAGAHWLVLASRQPLYRAVQQAGPDIARLLDFYSATERGRPVHVCVSLNARSADDDLRRLDAALRALLGA